MTKYNRFGDPDIIHINLKLAKPIVEELHKPIPRYIDVPVKNGWDQAQYRFACMDGAPHPLAIEREQYTLVTIHTQSIDASVHFAADGPHNTGRFSTPEIEFINSVQLRPEVEWAIDNSFDGVYVQKFNDHARYATSFQFAVYLKEEQATFWKLKFSGR